MTDDLKNKLIQLKKDIKQINYTFQSIDADEVKFDKALLTSLIASEDEIEVLDDILNIILNEEF